MTYTRRDWCIDLASAMGFGTKIPNYPNIAGVTIGDPNAYKTPDTYDHWFIDWLVAWTTFESGIGESGYNLLKTAQVMPGSTAISRVSPVQKFGSYSDGISATVAALTNGRYGALVNAFQTDDDTSLGISVMPPGTFSSEVPVASNIASEIKVWNGGGNYSAQDIAHRVQDRVQITNASGHIFQGTRQAVASSTAPQGSVDAGLGSVGTLFNNLTNPAFIKRLVIGAIGILAMLAGMGLAMAIFTGKQNGLSKVAKKVLP